MLLGQTDMRNSQTLTPLPLSQLITADILDYRTSAVRFSGIFIGTSRQTRTMKNIVFWDVTPCGSCKNRRFGEPSASIARVTEIGELRTTLT
jgi:hypothetical protein